MRLADRTTTTADLERVEVALLPTGSTEQHGPALPLGTDHVAAGEIAGAVGHDDAAVLPTVPVGVSEHHRQFEGTLWVADETFERYVRETLGSLARHGVRKAVIVNGHGGNAAPLRRAARRLRGEGTLFAAPWNWWQGLDGLEDELFEEAGGHADAMESSLMLHLRESLVRADALEDAERGAPDEWGESVHGADVGFDTVDFTETGAVGRPTQASREAGERLFERARESLDALIDWLAGEPFESLLPEESA